MDVQVELVFDGRALLGEGAIWHRKEGKLYWVDIEAGYVHCFDPESGRDQSISVGQMVGTVVPREKGGLMLAVEQGFASLNPNSGQLILIADPENHIPGNRFNDGKCDPAGRFWAGSMSRNGNISGAGSLYCLDLDLTVRQMATGFSISNGIAWSSDARTMFHVDTPTHQVDAYDYEIETGGISNRRTAITIPKQLGAPDGMTVDAEGMLWIAMWNGSQVTRWNPATGKLLDSISVPATQVTSCWFGGPDLTDLYITTALTGLTNEQLIKQPAAGGLLRARTSIQGLPTYTFLG